MSLELLIILCALACVAKESSLVPSVFPYPMSNIGKVVTKIICNLELIIANASMNH